MKKLFYLFFIFCLVGCDNQRVINISLENIFLQKERNYYVLFYLDGCMACRNTKLKLEELSKRNNISYYYINLKECVFYAKNDTNLNIVTYEEIYIEVTPTILLIDNRIIIAEYIGYQDILKWSYVV